MAAAPASPVPTISPAEMQILISRSGLVLNPGQMADLVLAWRQVAALIASIPQGRALLDDLAYGFRLPAPARQVAGSGAASKSLPAQRARTKTGAKAQARKTAAGAKTKTKPRPKPEAAQSRALRGR